MKQAFGKQLKQNFYNYCPSLIKDDDKLYVWYCTNKVNKNITDFIGYRTASFKDNTWVFSNEKIVLGPSKDNWDSRHTCDPSIIKGVFTYQNEIYNYLMAYLGCVSDDCTDNEVGLAFSKKIEGPWIKLKSPIARYIDSLDFVKPHVYWGYGQPCLISIDLLGQVVLFYTVGIATTFTRAELWDFTNLEEPHLLKQTKISNNGYINSLGIQDSLGNADFAYDKINKKLYAVTDTHIRGNEQPNYISNEVPLLVAELNKNETFPLETLFNGNYTWKKVFTINEDVTGFKRNHNPGIKSNSYGYLDDINNLTIAYTVSDCNNMHPNRSGIWQSLHTYRIYLKEVKLNEI